MGKPTVDDVVVGSKSEGPASMALKPHWTRWS